MKTRVPEDCYREVKVETTKTWMTPKGKESFKVTSVLTKLYNKGVTYDLTKAELASLRNDFPRPTVSKVGKYSPRVNTPKALRGRLVPAV